MENKEKQLQQINKGVQMKCTRCNKEFGDAYPCKIINNKIYCQDCLIEFDNIGQEVFDYLNRIKEKNNIKILTDNSGKNSKIIFRAIDGKDAYAFETVFTIMNGFMNSIGLEFGVDNENNFAYFGRK
jgi:uncharacterized Fe-S cluster-containing protein